jgi:DNA invertase Pin-like site-specific DNA recombinase
MKYSEAKEILEKKEKAKAVLEEYNKIAAAHELFGFKNRRELIDALQEIDQGERKKGRRGPRGLASDVISQIKNLKAAGNTNAAISRNLRVSALTVAKYVKNDSSPAEPVPAPAKVEKTKAKPKASAKKKAATRGKKN